MMYTQQTFSVYFGTEGYRANYDQIRWSDTDTINTPPEQGKARREEKD